VRLLRLRLKRWYWRVALFMLALAAWAVWFSDWSRNTQSSWLLASSATTFIALVLDARTAER
jgi:hypothetical protein